MKTLFVSDLDGTLLRSDESLSQYTISVINALVEKGMLFSYATARSYITAKKVTKGLNTSIPLILYNGTMVINNTDNSFMIKNFFDNDVHNMLQDLLENDISPIVYSFMEGYEKFSFIPEKCTNGMNLFIESRKNDPRVNAVNSDSKLHNGEIFYITCIDDAMKLKPLYDKYKDTYHCVFHVDIYTNEQWLEIMPMNASKSKAIRQLQKHLNCDRLVVFGDGKNDIDMFEIADESYAVQNAVDELKSIATDIIDSNNDDGVAKWLSEHYKDTV